jgi:hypothetical protein
MPRYAPEMTVDNLKTMLFNLAVKNDFEEEIGDLDIDDPDFIVGMLHHDMLKKVCQDWSKIDFDLENTDVEGFNTTTAGVPYVVLTAGGDWETPVTCIIYYDGKQFRGYVPSTGNTYNAKAKIAFGNADDEVDDEAAAFAQFATKDYENLQPVWDVIYADVDSRIEAKGTAVAGEKPKSNAAIKAEKQSVIEQAMDLTGDLTADMLYANISLAAGSSYTEFTLRASGRTLTIAECNRIVGLPTTFTKHDSSDTSLWYSPMGIYPQAALILLQARGFEKAPDNDISMYVGAMTKVIYI